MTNLPGNGLGKSLGKRALQEPVSTRVRLRDDFPKPLSTVAAFVAGDNLDAAAVLLDAVDFCVIEAHVISAAWPHSGEADQRSIHETAALIAAFRTLSRTPDLALVSGQGIAHPERFGIASGFGVAMDIATIGVATKPLIGTASALHQIRGAYTPLRDLGEQVGWLLRTHADADPLVVSPGHRVAMASAADLVMRFVKSGRLPEPLRLAQQLLSRAPGVTTPEDLAE